MSKNAILRKNTVFAHPAVTGIIGMTVFIVISALMVLIPDIGEVEQLTFGVPLAVLILFMILGVPRDRNVIILAFLSELFLQIGLYGGILVGHGSEFLSDGMISAELAISIFIILVIVVFCAYYLYGKRALSLFILLSLGTAVLFIFVDRQLPLILRNINGPETVKFFSELIWLAPVGLSLGLGAGIFNRRICL